MDTHVAPVPGEELLLDIADSADRWYADVVALPPGPPRRAALVRIREEVLGRLRAGLPDVECGVLLAMAPKLDLGPQTSDDEFEYAAVRIREWLAGMRTGAFTAIAARQAIRRGRPSDPRLRTSGPAAGPVDLPTVAV